MTEFKSPRERCYHAIRNAVGQGLASYYLGHRTLLGDPRSQDAIRASRAGVEAILAILDRYEISDPGPPPS